MIAQSQEKIGESLIGINKSLNQVGMLLDDKFNGNKQEQVVDDNEGYVDDFEEEQIPMTNPQPLKQYQSIQQQEKPKLSKEEVMERMRIAREKSVIERRKARELEKQKEEEELQEILKKDKPKKEEFDDFDNEETPEEEEEDDDF